MRQQKLLFSVLTPVCSSDGKTGTDSSSNILKVTQQEVAGLDLIWEALPPPRSQKGMRMSAREECRDFSGRQEDGERLRGLKHGTVGPGRGLDCQAHEEDPGGQGVPDSPGGASCASPCLGRGLRHLLLLTLLP